MTWECQGRQQHGWFGHGTCDGNANISAVDPAGATLGVMTGASLAVSMIGQALAQARGLATRHAVKQEARLLSNAGIDVWDSFARWVPQQVGGQPERRVGERTDALSLIRSLSRRCEIQTGSHPTRHFGPRFTFDFDIGQTRKQPLSTTGAR